ncbi:hypothetical protein MRX96_048788 [Rhipicephalus microplus]
MPPRHRRAASGSPVPSLEKRGREPLSRGGTLPNLSRGNLGENPPPVTATTHRSQTTATLFPSSLARRLLVPGVRRLLAAARGWQQPESVNSLACRVETAERATLRRASGRRATPSLSAVR